MAVGRVFFSAALTAQNSPELHFRFINSFIQSSLPESLVVYCQQQGDMKKTQGNSLRFYSPQVSKRNINPEALISFLFILVWTNSFKPINVQARGKLIVIHNFWEKDLSNVFQKTNTLRSQFSANVGLGHIPTDPIYSTGPVLLLFRKATVSFLNV